MTAQVVFDPSVPNPVSYLLAFGLRSQRYTKLANGSIPFSSFLTVECAHYIYHLWTPTLAPIHPRVVRTGNRWRYLRRIHPVVRCCVSHEWRTKYVVDVPASLSVAPSGRGRQVAATGRIESHVGLSIPSLNERRQLAARETRSILQRSGNKLSPPPVIQPMWLERNHSVPVTQLTSILHVQASPIPGSRQWRPQVDALVSEFLFYFQNRITLSRSYGGVQQQLLLLLKSMDGVLWPLLSFQTEYNGR
ncbi:hypothetical protein BJX63DRAFT_47014 [Aspergillus granulosus]|uniref:Uncharacterized protein n=1 Tax=Aspergillus granulosus TaxID=176169 RepID=A0ABR4HU19_9EURO